MKPDWIEEHYNVRECENRIRVEVSHRPQHGCWYASLSALVGGEWKPIKGSCTYLGGNEHAARALAENYYKEEAWGWFVRMFGRKPTAPDFDTHGGAAQPHEENAHSDEGFCTTSTQCTLKRRSSKKTDKSPFTSDELRFLDDLLCWKLKADVNGVRLFVHEPTPSIKDDDDEATVLRQKTRKQLLAKIKQQRKMKPHE